MPRAQNFERGARKKVPRADRQALIDEVNKHYQLSIYRSCQLFGVSQSSYYYRPKKKPFDQNIRDMLLGLAQKYSRWGFKKMCAYSRETHPDWNHKRIYRIYCELGLNLRKKPKKRLAKGNALALFQPLVPSLYWSMDFMSDALVSGVKFRTLNVIDDYNRETLCVEPSFSLPAQKVTDLLDEIAQSRGYPEIIRVDNGSEFTSQHYSAWKTSSKCVY